MTGQEAIPVPDPSEPAWGNCAWCRKRTSKQIQLEKPRYRTHGKVKVLAKAPIVAWVCDDHDRSLERTRKDDEAGVAIK